MIALPERRSKFVDFATNFYGKRGKSSQAIITSKDERAVFLGRNLGKIVSRCSPRKVVVIVLKVAALQTIHSRRLAKHGALRAIRIKESPFRQDVPKPLAVVTMRIFHLRATGNGSVAAARLVVNESQGCDIAERMPVIWL